MAISQKRCKIGGKLLLITYGAVRRRILHARMWTYGDVSTCGSVSRHTSTQDTAYATINAAYRNLLHCHPGQLLFCHPAAFTASDNYLKLASYNT